MAPLPSDLRRTLETTIISARDAAEDAARAALATLAVERDAPFTSMTEDQRRLRRALRAKARQLGSGDFLAGIPLLVEEIAYQQWHRMIFARFLAENDLLMHPEGVSVSLQDCADLAPEEGAVDGWDLAARYASRMLPGIFLTDDPVVQLRLAPEGRRALERILDEQPSLVFTSDDALGWVYQFWQSRRKDEVNASEEKIGAGNIGPVTQLFTEDYMVKFLLHNSLGAWWAARHPDSPAGQDIHIPAPPGGWHACGRHVPGLARAGSRGDGDGPLWRIRALHCGRIRDALQNADGGRGTEPRRCGRSDN